MHEERSPGQISKAAKRPLESTAGSGRAIIRAKHRAWFLALLSPIFAALTFAASHAGERANSTPGHPHLPSAGELSTPPLPTLVATWLAHPNLTLPTLGGLQFWQDEAYYAGWRVQRHVWTGHYRLLDPDNLRRGWGGATSTREQFEKLRDDPEIKPRGEHLVILIHGWGRTGGMFEKMEKALAAEGYDVLSISYPSTRAGLADHSAGLRRIINDLKGTTRVSFVTHSLGAIVLRRMLAEGTSFDNAVQLGRAVLIAAPNNGSVMAEKLQATTAFHLIGGPVAQQLTPEKLKHLPAPSIPFLLISGAMGNGGGLNPLIEGADDGIVGLAETILTGAEGLIKVASTHTFIADHPETLRATLTFLAKAH